MRVERLGDHHDVTSFSSGEATLDRWLQRHAVENQRRDLSRTFVLLDDDDVVIGYYALTMGGVRSDALPRRLGRGLPPVDLGMVLVGRLAVVEHRQGEGLGRDLLVDAVRTAAVAGSHAAARFVAVDPLHAAAAAFYARFGFRAVEGDQGGRMFMRMDVALEETLGRAPPDR